MQAKTSLAISIGLLLLLLTYLFLLAGCAGLSNLFAPPASIMIKSIEPQEIAADPENTVTVTFEGRTNSIGATVNRYEVEYYTITGTHIPSLSKDAPSNVYVPAYSEGAGVGTGEAEIMLVDNAVLAYGIETRLTEMRAQVVFSGTDDNGHSFQLAQFEVLISFPPLPTISYVVVSIGEEGISITEGANFDVQVLNTVGFYVTTFAFEYYDNTNHGSPTLISELSREIDASYYVPPESEISIYHVPILFQDVIDYGAANSISEVAVKVYIVGIDEIGNSISLLAINMLPVVSSYPPPVLISPHDGAQVAVAYPIFTWNAVAGALEYMIEVSRADTGVVVWSMNTSSQWNQGFTLTSTQYNIDFSGLPLVDDESYQWRVAVGDGLNSPVVWSAPYTFTKVQ